MPADLVGYIAACCTTGAFIPQVLHTWKTRDTQSISLSMYIVFITGILLWLYYGIQINNLPMTISNSVTLLLAGSVLVMKWRYG